MEELCHGLIYCNRNSCAQADVGSEYKVSEEALVQSVCTELVCRELDMPYFVSVIPVKMRLLEAGRCC